MLRIHVVYIKAKAVLYSKCVIASDSPMQGSPSLETEEAPGEKKSNRYVPGRFSGLAWLHGLQGNATVLPNKWPLTHIQFDYRTPNSFAARRNNTSITIVIVAGIFSYFVSYLGISSLCMRPERNVETRLRNCNWACVLFYRDAIFSEILRTRYTH